MNNRTPVIAAGLGHAVKAALIALAGCAFEPGGATAPGDGHAIDAAGDGALDPDAIVVPPDAPPATALCDLGDTTLVLCLPFDDGSARNRATSNLQAQDVTDVTPVTGRVGMGGGFGATTVVHFPEDSRLDATEPFAFELFVRLDQAPATTGNMRIGILDNDSQYSLFARVRDQGQGPLIYPYCNSQATVFSDVPLELGTWHHVACVQDAGTLTIYVDGIMSSVANTVAISTTGNRGTTIGQDCDNNVTQQIDDEVIGAIDEVRLWSAARTAAQIAAAAARR